jgi:N-methylhydantoinase A
MGFRIGVDIGGSFTDFAVLDEATNQLRSLKVFSRPDQPGAEVLRGIQLLEQRHGIAPREISYFTHGTTVGVNTVIQRKGLRLALFTTEHFCDVLELARLKIPNMYNLLSKRPPPLIPRDMVFGVRERIGAGGEIEQKLDRDSVAAALTSARAAGAEGVVIAFLHAYRDGSHEQAARAIIAELAPELPVFCSSETWPIIREYERTITAALGGYVQPRVAGYLSSLQAALRELGVPAEPRLTKSNGGVMTAEQGKRDCVQMILSGTASGVIGASYIAGMAGIDCCMSLDIGGTSADVALIIDGQPQYGVGERIGEFNIYIPSVSVSSVGDGGGSIAWVDPLGVLKVGPESAGSRPGPACYGQGGTRATITDAFVVCGLIGASELGYSAVTVDRERARVVIAGLAEKLGRGVEQTAAAIIRIAVSGMYAEVSALGSRFGIDIREFACLAFGGAGPMLACFVAHDLGMKEIVVPPTPGVLSALGGLIADVKNDFLTTIYADLDAQAALTMRDAFETLSARAVTWLRDDQGHHGAYQLTLSADMRYRGQSFEIDTALDAELVAAADHAAIGEAFHRAHERVYGHADRAALAQVIAVRLIVTGQTAKPAPPRQALHPGPAPSAGQTRVWIDNAWHGASLYQRAALLAGQTFAGPAIVMQDDCTTIVPPGFAAVVDEFTNLRITREIAA